MRKTTREYLSVATIALLATLFMGAMRAFAG